MNEENILFWQQELRSGKWEQGFFHMFPEKKNPDDPEEPFTACVLGVAFCLANGLETAKDGGTLLRGVLSRVHASDWLGLNAHQHVDVSMKNDYYLKSFQEIADWIDTDEFKNLGRET